MGLSPTIDWICFEICGRCQVRHRYVILPCFSHRLILVPHIFSATFFFDPTTSWPLTQPRSARYQNSNLAPLVMSVLGVYSTFFKRNLLSEWMWTPRKRNQRDLGSQFDNPHGYKVGPRNHVPCGTFTDSPGICPTESQMSHVRIFFKRHVEILELSQMSQKISLLWHFQWGLRIMDHGNFRLGPTFSECVLRIPNEKLSLGAQWRIWAG